MDAVAGLLDGPRARDAFLLRSILSPPWSIRIRDEAPLTVVAVVSGTACVVYDSGPRASISAGDVAIVCGPGHYTVADDVATPPQIVIHPGQVCTTPSGEKILRAWFATADAQTPAWYKAHDDPIIGHAMKLLHNNPAHPWTLAALADAAGVSRATFARRFHDLVGEPPMAFLTGWRLALAADLLRETDATIASIAQQVGYGSSFALSAAFKRVRGLSPQQYRAS